jgi:hypothetical protein
VGKTEVLGQKSQPVSQHRSSNLSESRVTDHEALSRATGQHAGRSGQPKVSLHFVLSPTHKNKFYINVASLNELSILCPLLLHLEAFYHNTDKSPLKLLLHAESRDNTSATAINIFTFGHLILTEMRSCHIHVKPV